MSLHEQAMELLQAGFSPKNLKYLNDKLRHIIKTEINSVIDNYRISLPESTASEAFVIPGVFHVGDSIKNLILVKTLLAS
jgi:hypothetical protein